MIRAVVRNGVIHPLDSIPPEWVDGFHVIVEDAASASNEELDALVRGAQKTRRGGVRTGRRGTHAGDHGRGRRASEGFLSQE